MNEIANLEKQEQDALTVVSNWVVASDQDYTNLDGFLVALADLKKKIVDDFADSKRKAFEAHRAITAQESAHLAKVDDARRLGKGKLLDWDRKQEAIRAEAEKQAQDAARRAAEDAQVSEALEAEKQGSTDQAEAILAAPVQVPTVVLPKSGPERSTKITMRKKWAIQAGAFRHTSEDFQKKTLRVSALAIPSVAPAYLILDPVAVTSLVTSLGKAAEKIIPGLSVFEVPC